jgi:hypothetical protein
VLSQQDKSDRAESGIAHLLLGLLAMQEKRWHFQAVTVKSVTGVVFEEKPYRIDHTDHAVWCARAICCTIVP